MPPPVTWTSAAHAAIVELDAETGFVKILRDVTGRKQVEEAEHAARRAAELANRMKDEFLATLSHELRTPLTPVMLTVSLMESHPGLPDDLRADVATIRRLYSDAVNVAGGIIDPYVRPGIPLMEKYLFSTS